MCGRSSTGDWIDINSSGINLMVALKPVQDGSRGVVTVFFDWLLSREASLDLWLPENLVQLKLSRIYRCTQNITKFYETFKSIL